MEKSFSLGVTPIVSRQNPPKRKDVYSPDDFIYNEQNDSFTCPQNKLLVKISNDNSTNQVYANKEACRSCPYKSQCFKQGGKHKYRRIIKDIHFKTLLKANTLFENSKELYHTRQELSEHVFGSIKRQLGFPQLNVRTKPKVEGEVSLLFLGYNLKRVINIVGNTELIRYFKGRTNSALLKIIVIFLNSHKTKNFKSISLNRIAIYSTV